MLSLNAVRRIKGQHQAGILVYFFLRLVGSGFHFSLAILYNLIRLSR